MEANCQRFANLIRGGVSVMRAANISVNKSTVYWIMARFDTTNSIKKAPSGPLGNKKRSPEFLATVKADMEENPTTPITVLAT